MTFVLKHTNVEQPDPAAHRHATIRAAAVAADVVTFNEAAKDHAVIRALPGFADYTVGENSIAWRTEKFTLVDKGSRLVMKGGRLGSGRKGDHRRRGPNRYLLWVVLEERASAREVLVATHHAIAKADTSAKWRRALRALGFRNSGSELVRGLRRNPSVVGLLLTGDLNTIGPRINFAGPSEVQVPTPATYGRLHYDRLFRSGGVKVSRVGTFSTRSDHKGLRATVELTDTPQAPPPQPPAPTPAPTPPTPPKENPPVKFPAPAPKYLGPAFRKSAGDNKPIRRIVIHSTVSPCEAGGARKIADYFRSPRAGGSAHYVVDPYEEVQCVYDGVIAWHAPPNGHSLGVEMCDMPSRIPGRWAGANHRLMLRRTAKLVAGLCLAYNVPVERVGVAGLRAGKRGICGHTDVSQAFHQSTHWDPGYFPWSRFMRLVRANIKEMKA